MNSYESPTLQALGVRPLINCKGTYTVIGGSLMLPEVKQAMLEASLRFVVLDELMDAVGRRLSELTQAEWGIVTSGCAAALALGTMACITRGDATLAASLPDAGAGYEVIIPHHSRMEYEPLVRMPGARIVAVSTPEELRAALNPRTALVLVMSSPLAAGGPLSIGEICRIAGEKEIPVLVDAAAETLTVPNVHLARGASLVAYSGGKILRGPQSAGLLLGRKDLVQAAWQNSSPHDGLGRGFKCGKEEIVGMLAAVEMWFRRDHDAEWRQWQTWLDQIAAEVRRIAGVSTEILLPEDLSNHSPRLKISWDPALLGVSGDGLAEALFAGEPRIALNGSSRDSIVIMPYMMSEGEAEVVAAAITRAFSGIPQKARAQHPAP